MSAKRAQKSLHRQGPSRKKRSCEGDEEELGVEPGPLDPSTTGTFMTPPETFQPLRLLPHEPESLVPADVELTPIGFFSLFWTDEILGSIVEATNAYAKLKQETRSSKWSHPVTITELRKFLGVTIMMGITRLSNTRHYWSRGLLSRRNSLSLRRYLQIKRYIHISIPEESENTSKLNSEWWTKLEPLHSHLQRQSQRYLLPGSHVSIDEMMVCFTGRSKHTIRIPSKPIPVGYKVIAICYQG